MTDLTNADETKLSQAILASIAKAEYSPGSKAYTHRICRTLDKSRTTVMRHLRDMPLLVRELRHEDDHQAWMLTEAGWHALGQKPPLWRAA